MTGGQAVDPVVEQASNRLSHFQMGSGIMNDEEFPDYDLAPETSTPQALPPLEVGAPTNMAFMGRRPYIELRIPAQGEHQVWLWAMEGDQLRAHWNGTWRRAGEWFEFPAPTVFDYHRATGMEFYGYWRGGDEVTPTVRRLCWAGNPASITEPTPNAIVGQRMRVAGVGAPGAKIRIVQTNNPDVVLSPTVNVSNQGPWEVTLTTDLPFGDYSITAQMSFPGYLPAYSQSVPLRIWKPNITLPVADQIVASHGIVFKGSGYPGSTITVVKAADHYDGVSVPTTVNATTKAWEAAAKAAPLRPSGTLTVQAQYLIGGVHGYSDTLTFRVLGVPAISAPAAASEQEQIFTLTGNNGLIGAKVEIFKDLGTTNVGESGVLTSANWTAQVTVDPGSQPLVALQNHSGKRSLRGTPRTFKIRPPKLQLPTVTYPSFATVKFSGVGYTGALVEIFHDGAVGGVQAQGTVVGNNWMAEKRDWLPGAYSMALRQSVSDGAGGRIYSNWGGTPIPVNIPVPAPTANPPTLNGQIPTFIGRGNVWTGEAAARIAVWLNGSAHALLPHADVVAGGAWTLRATGKLAPGTYTVTLWQFMNNLWSTAVTAPNLIIKPDPPSITQPGANATVELRTEFYGATWPNADVVVRYKDGAPIKAFTANPTTGLWSFNAELMSPGRITVQVQATFGGQASDWKDHTFRVKTPVPGISYPQNNGEVGFKLIVQGTNAFPDSIIKVFDATSSNKVLGRTTVLTTGAWAVELDKEFEKEGPQVIYALQEFGVYPSDRSADITFNVKVPVPLITTPADNARFARSSEVAGTGIPEALVSLKIGSTVIASDIVVDPDGHWRRTVNLPTVGSTTMVAEQNYKGGMRASIDRVFTVVPNAPVIESPSGGEFVTPAWAVVSGAGYPGDTVSVTRVGYTEVIGSFVVDPQGYWSGKLTHTLGGGNPYSFRARSTFNAVASDWSVTSVVTLLAAGPTLYEPAAGDWVGTQPFYRGLATPQATITVASCFNPEQVLASTTADANGRWEIQSSTMLPEGPCRVVVRQISGGVVSEWVESGRFMVEKMARDFTAPTVDYPKPGDSAGRKPVMSGSGVPGAYVQIFKAGALGELTGGFVDREGRWTAGFKEALPVGEFICSVRQLRDDVPSALRTSNQAFKVVQVPANFPGPVITGPQMNEHVEVQPLVSGTGMPGARVDVHKHNNLTQVEASAIVNAQGVWSLRLPVLTVGPYQMVARQFIDGQFSEYCASISITVTNTISPLVMLSPQSNAQVPPRPLIRGIALPGATVNLRKDGDGQTDYGTGMADAQGHWAIVVTRTLPIGPFVITGNVTKAGTTSGWMPVPVRLWVVNAG